MPLIACATPCSHAGGTVEAAAEATEEKGKAMKHDAHADQATQGAKDTMDEAVQVRETKLVIPWGAAQLELRAGLPACAQAARRLTHSQPPSTRRTHAPRAPRMHTAVQKTLPRTPCDDDADLSIWYDEDDASLMCPSSPETPLQTTCCSCSVGVLHAAAGSWSRSRASLVAAARAAEWHCTC